MILGTAGFTAGLCIDALLKYGVSPEKGKVIVTGSTGGVGILSVAILAKLGFEVVAVTGKPEAAELLQRLGGSRDCQP
jgi:NADPH:quinone reductase-like Zn-dependent oxidoreductase